MSCKGSKKMIINKINQGYKTVSFFRKCWNISSFSYGAKKKIDLFSQREQFEQTKQTIQISEQPNFLSIPKHSSKSPIIIKEFLANNVLTEDNVRNFDYLYRSPQVTSVKRHGSSRIIEKGRMKVNIPNVLKLKLGRNYDRILFFLQNRGEAITEVELHFCFIALTELKEFKRLASEETDVLYNVLQAASKLEYMNYTYIIELIAQALHENLPHSAYIKQLVKCAYNVLKDKANHYISLENVQLTLKVLQDERIRSLVDVVMYLDHLSDRMFQLSDNASMLIEFVKEIRQYVELDSSRAYINMETFLQEQRDSLSIQNLIDILYIYAKGNVNESILFSDLKDRLKRFHLKIEKVKAVETTEGKHTDVQTSTTAIISDYLASVLIWSISQFEKLKDDYDLWVFLEARMLYFLQSLRVQGQVVEKDSFSTIVRSFDATEQGSIVFWGFPFQEVLANDQEVVNLNFEELFIIFYNKLRFEIFDIEIFRGLLRYEMQTRLNYFADLPFTRAVRVLFVYLCGADYSIEILTQLEKDEQEISETMSEFKNQIDLLLGYLRVQLNFYLKQEFRMKELSISDTIRFFLCLGYGMKMGVFHLSEDTLRTWFIELKVKYDKLTEVFPKMLLNAFLWKFNSRIHIKRSVFEDDFFKILKTVSVVEFVPLLESIYFMGYQDMYLWMTIELRLIEVIELLSPDDFMKALAMMHTLQKGTAEFWEFCADYYAKVIQHCVDDSRHELFIKFLSVKELQEEKINQFIEKYKDIDPGLELASRISERPSLVQKEVIDIIEHFYGSTEVQSPLNSFYIEMLKASVQ